jgi:hypothetical protein
VLVLVLVLVLGLGLVVLVVLVVLVLLVLLVDPQCPDSRDQLTQLAVPSFSVVLDSAATKNTC